MNRFRVFARVAAAATFCFFLAIRLCAEDFTSPPVTRSGSVTVARLVERGDQLDPLELLQEVTESPTEATLETSGPTFGFNREDYGTSVGRHSLQLLPDTPLPVAELDAVSTSGMGAKPVSLLEAICWALESNQNLKIERLRPEISATSIESAWGAFDTRLSAQASAGSVHSSTLGPRSKSAPSSPREENENISRARNLSADLSGRLPTGTDYDLGITLNRSATNSSYPFYSSAVNLNITQNLLKGGGSRVNLVQVRVAENTYLISLYQLQQALINLIANVETAYWDLYLSYKTLEIRLEAYRLAKEQRRRTEEFVRVGRDTPLGLFGAHAEEAARISDVINAVAEVKRRRIVFLQLVNPERVPKGWETRVFPREDPVVPSEPLIPEQHVAVAMKHRPDLQQARLDLANGELEVVRTKNGLLPSLDFFTDLGLASRGDNPSDANAKLGDYPSWRIGLQFSYALQNRTARAAFRRAEFNRAIAEEAIENYRQIIEVDVRLAINEIERTKRLIESTHITRLLRGEELAAEIEKFRVGRSTQLLVAQAQRDLTAARVDEISAIVAHVKAYLTLFKAEGSILQRRGIQPVVNTARNGVKGH
ncbi:MAG: TolC family protein [Candidatus Sumerlaeaceae bacterium]|nr:TolC family protein [Candidatus Sumerlaeaceae bacterium]